MAQQAEFLPALYFVFSRRDTERFARGLSHWLRSSLLTNEDLRELGVPLGHRRLMMHSLAKLPTEPRAPPADSSEAAPR